MRLVYYRQSFPTSWDLKVTIYNKVILPENTASSTESLRNSTLITAYKFLWIPKIPFNNRWLLFPLPNEGVKSSARSVSTSSYLTPFSPTVSNLYLVNFLATLLISPTFPDADVTQKVLSRFEAVYPIPLQRTFIRWEAVSPTNNTLDGGKPVVGWPRLFIQYIHSYSQ